VLNYNCYGITYISMLGNLHTLYMWWCQNITDVSMLGNLHILNIGYCRNIKKYPESNNIVEYIY